MPKTIEMPVSLLEKMSKVTKAFEEIEDEIEDLLLSKDPKFLEKMRRARKDHFAGRTRPLKSLKKDLCIV